MKNNKEFWFIRHAESEGNAGLPTTSAGGIPLTERGEMQAKALAESIQQPPDLFVVSPYLRTAQTAAPTLNKFQEVPVETWPIEEYTYLPLEFHHNTTTAQRNRPAMEYFQKSDPDLILGEGAESFNQLIARVDAVLDRLAVTPHDRVYLFSHGWFMRTLLWRLFFFPGHGDAIDMKTAKERFPNAGWFYRLFARFGDKIRGNPMTHFLFFSGTVSIPNGAILKFNYDTPNSKLTLEGLEDAHIPHSLKSSHFSNR